MTEKDRAFLDGKVTDYFTSISDKFDFYRKNHWKKDLFIVLFWLFFAIILIAHVYPLPLDVDVYVLNDLVIWTKETFWSTSGEISFWTLWFLTLMVFIVPTAIFGLIYLYWRFQFKEKAVKYESLSFCYAYLNRKSLSNYLLNEHSFDLKKIVKHLEFIISPLHEVSVDGKTVDLITLEEFIEDEEITWFQISEKTRWFAKSIDHLFLVVVDRVEKRSDLESILEILDYVVLFEFSKIRPHDIDPDAESDDYSLELTYLENACSIANSIDLPKTEEHSGLNRPSLMLRITKAVRL